MITRLAIIADIHGNWQALQAVLNDIERQQVDQILSLGDNIGYGPEPEEVVSALQQRQVISVMGNHELALISRSYCNRMNATARESMALTRRLLSSSSCSWLENLPPYRICHGARLVHGCPPQSMTVYLFSASANRLQRLFSSFPEQICFAGHTHTLHLFEQVDQEIGQRHLAIERLSLNRASRCIILPGSVGQPRDTVNRHAKYAIWDRAEQSVELRAVPYDVETTVRLLGERQFPLINAKRLVGQGQ